MRHKKQELSQLHGVIPEKGETLMEKLRKMTINGDTPEDELPTIYTDKGQGVLPGYDIRTDRFEVAREATEKLKTAEKTERAEQKQITKERKQKQEENASNDKNESNTTGSES